MWNFSKIQSLLNFKKTSSGWMRTSTDKFLRGEKKKKKWKVVESCLNEKGNKEEGPCTSWMRLKTKAARNADTYLLSGLSHKRVPIYSNVKQTNSTTGKYLSTPPPPLSSVIRCCIQENCMWGISMNINREFSSVITTDGGVYFTHLPTPEVGFIICPRWRSPLSYIGLYRSSPNVYGYNQ